MIVRTVVSPFLGTNCYVVSADDGATVVVDPGAGVVGDLLALVQDRALAPVALLATHGHVDHTWSAAALGSAWGVPLVLHEADAYRLADPFGTLGPLGAQLAPLAGTLGDPYREPSDVRTFGADAVVPLAAALGLRSLHSPGHTEGSTVYLLDPVPAEGSSTEEPGPTAAFTGDVLFAGTVGRTDLPGGDADAMGRSLARLAGLPAATRVLPGHGEASTVEAELRSNPYLLGPR
nr:MBL fold metallo-hydrolase [uncultured Actinotalea sp.]